MNNKIGLYIHIPFCQEICSYCDFIKTNDHRISSINNYFEALLAEVVSKKKYFPDIDTIYIGGGTPNSVAISYLEKLLIILQDIHPREYTIETNSELYTPEQGDLFVKYGITRVSIGVQTFQKPLINLLNRFHNFSQVEMMMCDLRSKGINNINIDMILAIPTQTMGDLQEDIQKVLSLKPTHISYYSLILEDKTKMMWDIIHGKYQLIDEDLNYEMTKLVINSLQKNAYQHYEISNFALKGFVSQHNLKYWTYQQYLGLGQGACSLIDNQRITNTKVFSKYLKGEPPLVEVQDQMLAIEDEMIFGLRKMKGVNIKIINLKYQCDVLKLYPQLNNFIENHFLVYRNNILRLSKKGYYVANQIFEVFL